MVAHIIPAKTMDFFISVLPGREFLDKANTIPNKDPIDIPRITPAKT